jgi:prepilin peptidase CpaA
MTAIAAIHQVSVLHLATLGGFFAMAVYAALSDAANFRIPNFASIGIVALFPLHIMTSPIAVAWLPAVAVAGAVFLVGLLLFAGGWAGGGDIKLISAAALWAGPSLVVPFLVIMGLGGGVLAGGAMVLQSARRFRTDGSLCAISLAQISECPKIPYGIAIAAGAIYVGVRLLIG